MKATRMPLWDPHRCNTCEQVQNLWHLRLSIPHELRAGLLLSQAVSELHARLRRPSK